MFCLYQTRFLISTIENIVPTIHIYYYFLLPLFNWTKTGNQN